MPAKPKPPAAESLAPAAKPVYIGRTHAAKELDCSVQLVDKFRAAGILRAFKLGRKVLPLREDVMRLVEQGEVRR
jgi:hypothetical protein